MGFYNKNSLYYLPNKMAAYDIFERSDAPDKESFTPYNGMKDVIYNYKQGDRFQMLDLTIVKNSIKNDITLKGLRESYRNQNIDDLNSLEDMGDRLEDISEDIILSYVHGVLSGLTGQGKSELKKAADVQKKVQVPMFDEETGELYKLAETRVTDESEDHSEELEQAKEKIPYLLKKLQDGSIRDGTSYLSLFIASDILVNGMGISHTELKPSDVLYQGIYKVDKSGNLLSKWDSSEHNNSNNRKEFTVPLSIVKGVYPNDPIYKAGRELTTLASKLGFNLRDEDIKEYSPSYINNLMNSYILSNQEVLEDMSAEDPKVMELFKDGNLFKPSLVNVNTISKKELKERLREMAEVKRNMSARLHNRIKDNSNIDKVSEPVKLIDQFLNMYKSMMGKSAEIELGICDVDDCYIISETLSDENKQAIVFRSERFTDKMGDTPFHDTLYTILTQEGYLIKVDNDSTNIRFTTVDKALEKMRDYNIIVKYWDVTL